MSKRSIALKTSALVASAGLFAAGGYMYRGAGDTYNYNYNISYGSEGDISRQAAAAPYAGTCSVVASGIKGHNLWVQMSTDPYDLRVTDMPPYYLPAAPMAGPDAYTAHSATITVSEGDGIYTRETVDAKSLAKGGPHSADTEVTFDLGKLGANPADIEFAAITATADAGQLSCGSPAPETSGLYFLDPQGLHPVDG